MIVKLFENFGAR